MKSRKVKIAITSAVLALLLAVFTVGYTFAWFSDYASISINLYTNAEGGYFKSGSGAENDPYILTTYRHLYNLAWLQNTGKFDSDTIYFQLDNDINMASSGSYCVIPPIGNDDHPFNGTFDGGGNTISNLVVSTDKTKLSNTDTAAASSYEFSKYVGLFGNTGANSNISNFILDNPIVEVASENTSYASESSACVGLAIGYVANAASSIGVIGGYLSVQKTGYTTYNSILGDISDSIKTSITGGDDDTKTSGTTETTDGDTGYFIADLLKEKINSSAKYLNTSYSKSNYIYTFKEQAWITSVNGLTEDGVELSTLKFLGLGSFSFTTGGIAYGDTSNSFEPDAIRSDKGTIDSTTKIYIGGGSSGTYTATTSYFTLGGTYFDGETETTYSPDSEDNNSANLDDKKKYWKNVVNSSGDQCSELTYTFYMEKSPSDVQSTGYQVISENGELQGESSTYKIWSHCILVNITDPENAKLVMIVQSNNSVGTVAVNRVVNGDKNKGGTDLSNFDFATGYARFSTSDGDLEMSDPQPTDFVAYSHYKDYPVYYQIDLTEGAGIYSINTGKSGFHIYYLAVTGVDDGSTGTETDTSSDGTYNKDCGVSAIDFIYSGVTIVNGDFVLSSDSNAYKPTGTMIYLSTTATTSTTAVLVIAYARSSDYEGYYDSAKTYTIYINYSGTDKPTGSDNSLVYRGNTLSGVTVPSTGDEYKSDTG